MNMRTNWKSKLIAVLLTIMMVPTLVPSISFAGDSGEEEPTAAAKSQSVEKEEPKAEEKPKEEPKATEAPKEEPKATEAPKEESKEESQPASEPSASEDADRDAEEASDDSGAEADQNGSDSDSQGDVQNEETDAAETELEPVEEEDPEEEYPAVTFDRSAGGVSVHISAPEGALPEGATVSVAGVSAGSIEGAVENAFGEDTSVVKAVNITFKNKDGKEIEPKKSVSVTFTSGAFSSLQEPGIVHFKDGGGIEKVSNSASGNSVSMHAKDFSVYAIVEEGKQDPDARLKVVFEANGEEIASVYVKENDDTTIDEIVYDPGYGTLNEGQVFKGWTTESTYSTSTPAMSMSDVRDKVRQVLPTSAEGDELVFHAMIFKTFTVRYRDENSVVIGSESILTTGDSENYTINMDYDSPDPDVPFIGWFISDETKDNVEVSGDAPYANGTEVVLKGNADFNAKPSEGHWIIFKENGQGASYTPPQYYKTGEDTEPFPESKNPTRKGYVFDGWYENAEGTGTPFVFGNPMPDADVILYAKWKEDEIANYTIRILTQNKACDGYDIEKELLLSAAPGYIDNPVTPSADGTYATVDGTDYKYEGFKLFSYPTEDKIEVKADGTTVVEVKYNRIEYTLTFEVTVPYYYKSTKDMGNGKTHYGFANGKYVLLDRHQGGGRPYFVYHGTNTRYEGTLYKRINNPETYSTTKTSGYGTDISDFFPVKIEDGNHKLVTYDDIERWQPQNSQTITNPIIFLEEMPGENITFTATVNDVVKLVTLNYYVEDLNGSVTYAGLHFTLLKNIVANPATFTKAQDFFDIPGYTQFRSNPDFPASGEIDNDGSISSFNFYYKSNPNQIIFMDGVYADANDHAVKNGTGEVKASVTVTTGSDISAYGADLADKDDYVFEGWYADEICKTKYTFNVMPAKTLTVYAKWRQKQYRVFLHPNADGKDGYNLGGASTSFRVDYGETIHTVKGISTDYELVGWYLDSACETTPYTGQAATDAIAAAYSQTEPTELDDKGNPTSTVNKDAENNRFWIKKKIDLYAKWEPKLGAEGINIEYVEGEHGSNPPVDARFYEDGSTAVAGDGAKAAEGYQFDRWMVQTVDDNNNYVDTENFVKPGEQFAVKKEDAKKTGSGDKLKYTVRLVAQYKPVGEKAVTTITYDPNGGSGDPVTEKNLTVNNDTDAESEMTVKSGDLFTRDGYAFKCWNTMADGSGTNFKPRDKISVDLISRDKNDTSNTLYSQWTPVVEVFVTGSADTKTYSGAEQKNENYTITYKVGGKTVSELPKGIRAVDENGEPIAERTFAAAGKDVGNYSQTIIVRLINDAGDQYEIGTEEATADISLTITPAPLKITTGGGTKVFDGTALTNSTASIEGLVGGETVTISATGIQITVGSSKNTYVIDWGDVKETNYTIEEEDLGTLTVEPAVTPSPDNDDDDDDTDVDDNGGEDDPGDDDGTAGGTGGTGGTGGGVLAALAATNPAPGAVIADPPTPTTINDEPTPQANPHVWALINLISMLLTALLSLVMLIRHFGQGRKSIIRPASLIPAIGGVIAFILTEDMSNPMAMVDKWTVLMVVILAVQIVGAIAANMTGKENEEETATE